MKGGSPHAPLAGIGPLYLGMHASDAAALLGPLGPSICPISICSILDFIVRFRTISHIVQDPARLTQLVRSLSELSHHLKFIKTYALIIYHRSML